MKKVRAANKVKLKSLEWTDEAIEQLTYANPQARVFLLIIALIVCYYFFDNICLSFKIYIFVR